MNGSNPYSIEMERTHRRWRKSADLGIVELVDKKTGEVTTGSAMVGNNKTYDATFFVKFYKPRQLFRVSQRGLYVFLWIAGHLRFGGYVEIDYDDVMRETGYKNRSSVYRGLVELMKEDVIREKDKGEYWVNPNIIYRGQRM